MHLFRMIRAASVAAIVALGAAAFAPTAFAASDTLTVALSGDIDNFDPATNQLIAYQAAILNTVYDSLVSYDADLKLQPRLAKEYSVNKDATVFTFKLVENATFQDGTPVNADAVIASLKRAAKLGGVIGGPLQRISKYEAPDEHTVVLTLNAPFAPFLSVLNDVAIMAPGSFDTATKKPVGSGPFMFESWTPNDKIVLKRNDKYWGPKPAYSTLIFKPIPDPQVALTDLYAGDVDIIAEPSTAVVSQVDTSQAQVIRPTVSNSIGYIEMSGTKPTLHNINLRRALAYAFDRKSIKAVAFGGQGDSVWSPLPTGSWAYSDVQGYDYDLDKAKAALEASGAKNVEIGLEVLAGFPEAAQMARIWQASLAKIGIKLDINTSETSVWLDRYVKRNYDMTWNFFGVSPDPNSFFDVIMRPHLENEYKNPHMLDLMKAGISTSDMDARKKIYAQLQDIMVDELPVMTIQSRPIAAIARKGITGFKMNPLGWCLYNGVVPQ